MTDKSIIHAISGGLSGLVSMALTYPLVTLSTNAQTKNIENNNNNNNEEIKKLTNDSKLSLRTLHHEISQEFGNYKENTNDSIIKIKLIKLQIILKKLLLRFKFILSYCKKYYSGLESALVGIVAVNFVYYYIYNLIGNYLKRGSKNSLNISNSLITGLSAGIVSRVITNPIWVANTRMTVNKDSSSSTLKVIYNIYQNEGINGLLSGLGPALILVTSPMIQFTIYEQLKNLLIKFKRVKGLNTISSIDALLLGSFGKLIAILITYPYYTIRARMHMKKIEDNNDNSFKLFYKIIKNEGINSLYKGIESKILQSVLSAGLIFYFKEEMMSFVELLINQINNKNISIKKITSKSKNVFRK